MITYGASATNSTSTNVSYVVQWPKGPPDASTAISVMAVPNPPSLDGAAALAIPS